MIMSKEFQRFAGEVCMSGLFLVTMWVLWVMVDAA